MVGVGITLLIAGLGVLVYSLFSNRRSTNSPQDIKDYYDSKRGVFTAWWQTVNSAQRVQLLATLNQEQLLLIEQGAILENAIREGEKTDEEFKVFLAQNTFVLALKNSTDLMQIASSQGYTLETNQELKRAEGLARIDLERRWKRDCPRP